MDIDRRRVLIGSAGVALTSVCGGVPVTFDVEPPGTTDWAELHPLSRSLLERARRIGQSRTSPDRALIERKILQLADSAGRTERPVIKWMDTPADAFEHLSRFGLDALLDMGTARFWRRCLRPTATDAVTLNHASEVWLMANDLLGVDEQDRLLTAPKLKAKSLAISSGTSASEVFRARALSAQIGWLETSLADVAAEAVSNVELLMVTGASEASAPIHHQLKVFETFECGLLATWETPRDLICVPRQV
jgi:hypothetical protein